MIILLAAIIIILIGNRLSLLDDSIEKLLYVQEETVDEGFTRESTEDTPVEGNTTPNTLSPELIGDEIVSNEDAINMLNSIYNGGGKKN